MESGNRMNRDLYEYILGLMKPCLLDRENLGTVYCTYYGTTLYDWDSYFENIILLYMGWGTEYQQKHIRSFLMRQRENGFICRYDSSVPQTMYPEQDNEHCKPILAQSTVLCLSYDGDLDWFTPELYDRMKKYLLYWAEKHSVDGLAFYRSGPHSGLDTQTERCGVWCSDFDGAVDLNCFLYRDYLAFARIAELFGREEDAERFTAMASDLREEILSLWDEADGFFYDRNVRTGEPIRVKTVAGFFPMWAGIATPRQAQILAYDHMFNPAEFYRNYPFSAMSASEPGFSTLPLPGDIGICNWRANTWMPTNYVCIHGLMNYGYADLAELAAYKTAELMAKSRAREFYNSEDGSGCGLDRFAGWSLLGYFLPMETAEGFDPTDLTLLPEDLEELMPYFRLPPSVEL